LKTTRKWHSVTKQTPKSILPDWKQKLANHIYTSLNISIVNANTWLMILNVPFGSIVMINLIVPRCSTHGLLLCFILLHISNSSVSTSLVGHVLYSADLMSTTCIPHSYLMVHRYIYSRYSSVFLTLYQLYHSLLSLTPISFSSLHLSVTTWVTP